VVAVRSNLLTSFLFFLGFFLFGGVVVVVVGWLRFIAVVLVRCGVLLVGPEVLFPSFPGFSRFFFSSFFHLVPGCTAVVQVK